MNIHENIRKYRKELGFTMEELGKKIGSSKQTIDKYESGEVKNIPYDKISALAEVFKISNAELMGWEKSPKEVATEDMELLDLWRKLGESQKQVVIATMKAFIEKEE